MEVLNEHSAAKHPLLQAVILIMGAIVGMLVFILLGFLLIAILYGPELILNTTWIHPGPNANVGAIKILLTSQQLGLFLMPALILAWIEKQSISRYYGVSFPVRSQVLNTIIFMLVAMPLFSAINGWNQEMTLPNFLKDVEAWMKAKEQEALGTTKLILTMKTWGAFISSIIVIGIVPAICEEFLFRGALQKVLGRIVANVHFQIWVAATIFSVIHFQFYGFFPRLFLGVAFGYLYVWSGNIWYAVLAHFVNNTFAVVISFYYQSQGKSIENVPEGSISAIGTLLSFALAAWFYYKFYKNRHADRLN
ncbi:MAG: CPBP family intramembrane metalloprotease [Pedobacter sp.]|nr:MAG: CPBP family intramembrane metalloprotease [Pedobacter sp.]